MKLINKDALAVEIENCIDRCNIKKRSCPANTQVEAICDNKICAYKEILSFLNTFEVKKVQEEPVSSIWHDAYQQPTMCQKYLVRYSDGRVSGSWERHDDGFISWKDVIKEHGFTHWCYVEDLLKL